MPVTRPPPCRPERAVFPPPVPRLHSHPRRGKPWLLWPTGRLAHADPVGHVRDECPCRATCFRRVLPRVVGFPPLRVLGSIRLPNRIRWAFPVTGLLHLPAACLTATLRFQHGSVSGFPLPCLKSCRPYTVVFHGQERLGPPKFFMPRPEDSGGPAHPRQAGWARVALGSVQTLGVRHRHVEAVPALQGTRLPLRSPGYAVYASSLLFARDETPTPPWTQDAIRVGGSP
jgi:hypothetical protein